MGNVLDPVAQNRIASFKTASDRDIGYLMDNLKSADYLYLYKVIEYHIDKFKTTPEIITGNILKMVSSIKNVSFLPLINYTAYSGMTAITNITKALLSFPAFPWNALIKRNPLVQSELKTYNSILIECSKDLYLGYKASGVATAIPTLAYICTQLLVEVGGVEVGGHSNLTKEWEVRTLVWFLIKPTMI